MNKASSQSINQSIKPVSLQASESINWSIDQTNQLINRSIDQSDTLGVLNKFCFNLT